ncbi:MAG: lysophospholipid acyltransferase family protein [Planctomycetota bacterium]|jgi:KDO2-lipid IV(A) lauroyltransferase
MKWVSYPLELIATLPFCLLFCLLPRPWAHRVGRRLGLWAYYVSRRSRNVALENLQSLLGLDRAEARRVAKASLKMAGASISDMLRAPRVTRRVVQRDIEVPNAARATLETIRRSGQGAVLATSHFGNWELGNLVWPLLGVPAATVIVRPVPNPLLNALLLRLRGWTGQRVIHRTGAVKRCIRGVRQGEIVMITVDVPVPPDAGAVPVDFFGLPTFTTLAAGYVAAATGRPLYVAYLLPLGKQRYRVVLEGPFEAAGQEPTREVALALTRRVSEQLEEAIRGYPEAWAWWQKRWRIRPEGAEGDFPSYSIDERWLWPDGTRPRQDVPTGR